MITTTMTSTSTIPDCHDVGTIIRWVRRRWIEVSGRRGTPIVSPERFLYKLRSGGHIDRQTFLEMRRTLQDFNATVATEIPESMSQEMRETFLEIIEQFAGELAGHLQGVKGGDR
jgi:hypothetical protein